MCFDALDSKMSETDKLKHLIHVVRLLIEVSAPS